MRKSDTKDGKNRYGGFYLWNRCRCAGLERMAALASNVDGNRGIQLDSGAARLWWFWKLLCPQDVKLLLITGINNIGGQI